MMTPDLRMGLIAGMGAYLIWGLLPLYFHTLIHIAPEDILAHRVLWSIPTAFALILVAKRWDEFLGLFRRKVVFWLFASAVLIGINWLVYIWAVANARVMEAALGYYMNPLINVAVGAIFLSERLRKWQWVAVALAAVAVCVEASALGRFPWVSLVLSFSFAAYSLIRRQVQIDSRVGFTVEVLLLAPIAAIWLAMAVEANRNTVGNGGFDWVLLALAGPITAIPLILFAVAAKRLRFSTIGIMQYFAPSLQFLIALAFGEPLTPLRAVTFLLIWAAIIVFSVDAFGHERRMRLAARPA